MIHLEIAYTGKKQGRSKAFLFLLLSITIWQLALSQATIKSIFDVIDMCCNQNEEYTALSGQCEGPSSQQEAGFVVSKSQPINTSNPGWDAVYIPSLMMSYIWSILSNLNPLHQWRGLSIESIHQHPIQLLQQALPLIFIFGIAFLLLNVIYLFIVYISAGYRQISLQEHYQIQLEESLDNLMLPRMWEVDSSDEQGINMAELWKEIPVVEYRGRMKVSELMSLYDRFQQSRAEQVSGPSSSQNQQLIKQTQQNSNINPQYQQLGPTTLPNGNREAAQDIYGNIANYAGPMPLCHASRPFHQNNCQNSFCQNQMQQQQYAQLGQSTSGTVTNLQGSSSQQPQAQHGQAVASVFETYNLVWDNAAQIATQRRQSSNGGLQASNAHHSAASHRASRNYHAPFSQDQQSRMFHQEAPGRLEYSGPPAVGAGAHCQKSHFSQSFPRSLVIPQKMQELFLSTVASHDAGCSSSPQPSSTYTTTPPTPAPDTIFPWEDKRTNTHTQVSTHDTHTHSLKRCNSACDIMSRNRNIVRGSLQDLIGEFRRHDAMPNCQEALIRHFGELQPNVNGSPPGIRWETPVGPDLYDGGEGDDECSICYEELKHGDQLFVLSCGHVFHVECVSQWVETNSYSARQCPLCRTNILQQRHTLDGGENVSGYGNGRMLASQTMV